jgi:hypothetical protein
MPDRGRYNERRCVISNKRQMAKGAAGCSPPLSGLEPFAPCPDRRLGEWLQKA